jgi:heme exporter protein B
MGRYVHPAEPAVAVAAPAHTGGQPAVWWRQAVALAAKDLRAELRTRVALSAVGVFTFAALLLLALATEPLRDAQALRQQAAYGLLDHPSISISRGDLERAWDPVGKMGLLWVLLSFAAFSGLSHSFVHEEETGTVTALRLSAPAGAIYAGKLAFNLLLIFAVAAVITPVYMLITGMPSGRPIVLLLMMLGGCTGLGAAATIVAALAAKARSGGALYGALGLPLLVVFLLLLLNAATTVYTVDAPVQRIVRDVGGLFSYGVLIVAVSALTFRYVWEE